MWTITASVQRKNRQPKNGLQFILGCEGQQLAYDDEAFCTKMQEAAAYVTVVDSLSAEYEIRMRDWIPSTLKEQNKYSTEFGSAWLTFSDFPSALYITIVLGSENEKDFLEDLNTALLSQILLVQISLDVWFSAVEDNRNVSWPTQTRFLHGEPAFAHKPPILSLVRRVP